jgi:hypothetical protein
MATRREGLPSHGSGIPQWLYTTLLLAPLTHCLPTCAGDHACAHVQPRAVTTVSIGPTTHQQGEAGRAMRSNVQYNSHTDVKLSALNTMHVLPEKKRARAKPPQCLYTDMCNRKQTARETVCYYIPRQHDAICSTPIIADLEPIPTLHSAASSAFGQRLKSTDGVL